MRNLFRSDESIFRQWTATGLIPSLLLACLPGCAMRDLSDWSRVQSAASGIETEVHLYENDILLSHTATGTLQSATSESVTLEFKDRQAETYQKKDVHKVRTWRHPDKRWPAWIALGVSALLVAQLGNLDGPESNRVYIQLFTTLPIAAGFFYGSRMGTIYDVPPAERDSSGGSKAPAAEAMTNKNSR